MSNSQKHDYGSSNGFLQREIYMISAMNHLYTQNKSRLLFDYYKTEAQYSQSWPVGGSVGRLPRTLTYSAKI